MGVPCSGSSTFLNFFFYKTDEELGHMCFYTQSASTVILGQKRARKLTSLMD